MARDSLSAPRRRAPRPWHGLLAGALALLATAVSGTLPAAAGTTTPSSSRDVVIRYTEYGMPHIRANSFTGLGQGYGYASAKDNLCLLAETYLTVDAGRSRWFGPDKPSGTELARTSTNLVSDLYFQQVNDSGVVERALAAPAPAGPAQEVRELVRGYVSGYNRYLRETGAAKVTDPACRGAGWLRPITELDVYRHFHAITTVSGSGSAAEGIAGAQPPAPPAAAPPASPAAGAGPASRSAARAPEAGGLPADAADRFAAAVEEARGRQDMGSNAIAVGSQGASAGRSSVLLGNPHYPWQGPRRFWQSQLTIPGRFNVSGASLLGFPLVMIGHNQDVAWSHTVSTAATFGLYEVPLAEGDPTTYLVDGVPEKMTSRTVRVKTLAADGTAGTVERTLWSTRYGPVVNSGPGVPLPWGRTAYALRDPNLGNLRALNSWFGLDGAQSTTDVAGVLSRTQGLPWVNTVATDRAGNAFYGDLQVVPHVTEELAGTCSTPLGKQVFPMSGISVLDGSRSACVWGSDADAVQPGILGPSRLPRLTRRDFVANFNDSPWLANPAQPLSYPRGVGDPAGPRSARTQEGILTAQRRIAGTDGLPGRGFSGDTMEQLLFDDRSRTAELLLADTRALCAALGDGTLPGPAGPLDATAGCKALGAWDGTYRSDSRGSLLFSRFVARLGAVPGGPWAVPFDPADPVGTPRGLRTDRPEVRAALGGALADLLGAGIAPDAPLSEGQAVTRAGERIPVHGAAHQLGVLNVITPSWDPAKGNTEVVHGSSFIQVVEFAGRAPVRASTLLTYSQSSDPTSPHFRDQTELFAAGKWVTGRFTESAILASPRLSTVRLAG